MSSKTIAAKIEAERQSLLKAFLEIADQEAITSKLLGKSEEKAGLVVNYGQILFPGGIDEVIKFLAEEKLRELEKTYPAASLEQEKVRNRIFILVKAFILLLSPHQMALKHILRYLAQPSNFCFGQKLLWKIADQMWWQAGDKATDFNHYTKRLLLSKVLVSTMNFWSRDASEEYSRSWSFLERQIAWVLKIGTIKQLPKKVLQKIPFVRLLLRP